MTNSNLRVGAAQFKERCSDIVERIHQLDSEVSVTQRGREVARLRSAPRQRRPRGGTEGSVRFHITGDELVHFNTADEWTRELREDSFDRDTGRPEKSDEWKTLAGTLLWEADDIITPIPGVWDDDD